MACNICGGLEFGPAPGNRLSNKKKLPPLCLRCRSTERHRITRRVQERLRIPEIYKEFAVVSWSDNLRIEDNWFGSVTRLAPDSEVQFRGFSDGSIDLIVFENIFHRCENPNQVLGHLARVVKDGGLIILSYPNPITRAKTEDWGTSDPKRGGARRIFGRDYEASYGDIVPSLIVMRIEESDLVTQENDFVYIASKTPFWMRRALEVGLDVRVLD